MAQLQTPFDATKVDPSQGVGQLPVGNKLPVVITESEVKATKDNSGGYIQFVCQVQNGEHAGRKGAYRINLYNASEAARGIAERQLSALCHVTQVFHLQNSQQLHNIPFLIDVAAQQDPKYTEVKAVYDINGNEPGRAHQQDAQHNNGGQQQQQQTQQNDQQQQQQNNNSGASWGNQNNGGNNAPQNNNNGGAPAWGNNGGQQQDQQTQQNTGGWNQNNNNNGGDNKPAWGR